MLVPSARVGPSYTADTGKDSIVDSGNAGAGGDDGGASLRMRVVKRSPFKAHTDAAKFAQELTKYASSSAIANSMHVAGHTSSSASDTSIGKGGGGLGEDNVGDGGRKGGNCGGKGEFVGCFGQSGGLGGSPGGG